MRVLVITFAALAVCVGATACKPGLDCNVLCAADYTGCPRGTFCGGDGYCYADQAGAASRFW